jgi:hypothetical protein
MGIALWLQKGLRRSDEVTLPTARLAELGLDRYAAARALACLEAAGLVAVSRCTGRKAIITLLAVTQDYANEQPQIVPEPRD